MNAHGCHCFVRRTKALVLELLAAVCLVRGGHEIILSAFDNFKEVAPPQAPQTALPVQGSHIIKAQVVDEGILLQLMYNGTYLFCIKQGGGKGYNVDEYTKSQASHFL